jgi:hypothetical protein
MLGTLLCTLLCSAAGASVFNALDFGATGTGMTNDTAAIQRTIDMAAKAKGGVAWLPGNATFLLGGGLILLGHEYDGVTLKVDGNVTIPVNLPGSWSTPAQCGLANSSAGAGGIPRSLCSILVVINVDSFSFVGTGNITGFPFDEHKQPQPAGSFHFVNTTNTLVGDGMYISHVPGQMWFHFCQHLMVRNITLFNRNLPEETGNIEIGGAGSHGMPPPLCEYGKSGWVGPTWECEGGNWQYNLPLLRTRNITVRDSDVSGGDDNVCIKNDTQGVLVENVHFRNGHGASIGSVPDCNGCHGIVKDITFRNCTFGGNAPMKIKTWYCVVIDPYSVSSLHTVYHRSIQCIIAPYTVSSLHTVYHRSIHCIIAPYSVSSLHTLYHRSIPYIH